MLEATLTTNQRPVDWAVHHLNKIPFTIVKHPLKFPSVFARCLSQQYFSSTEGGAFPKVNPILFNVVELSLGIGIKFKFHAMSLNVFI